MIVILLSLKCQTITLNKMKRFKVKEILKMLIADGWFLSRTKSSHRQYKHLTKKGTVTINGKPSDTLNQFILNSIFKQAGWK